MNPFEMLKNLDSLKQQAESMKQKMSSIRCTGYSGAGMVEVVATGNMEIESVKIDPSIIKPEDSQFIAVLVASAVNTALKNVKDRIAQEAGQVFPQ